MESATPSARDVAAKILGRSGLVTSSRNIKESVTTPSEDATPKTLIGGILNAASISKSGLIAPTTRKSKLTKSPTTGPPAKRKKAMRQSLGDNATPRTIIKNFLMEASPETPLEVPLKLPEKTFHDESSESDSSDQSLPDDIQAPASSPEPDSKDEICDSEMDSLPNSEDSKSALAGEVKEGNNALPREDSVNNDNEDKEVLSPAPVNAEVDIPDISSPEPGYESSTTTATATDIQESQTTTTATDIQESQTTTTPTDKQESQTTTTPTDIQESQTTTTPTDKQESQSDSIRDTDIIMPSINTGTSEPPLEKRIWKELMTPHELPVRRRNVLSEKQMVQVEEEEEENESERTSKAAKKPPPATKRTKTKSTSACDTNLPSGLVKSIFQHFSKSRISRNTINSIEKGSSVFFKQISSDLMAYSKHAGRSTIEIGDVELLMKRQGFITDKQSLNSLIEKYLPLEYRQELIPVVQSGNKVVLKKSN